MTASHRHSEPDTWTSRVGKKSKQRHECCDGLQNKDSFAPLSTRAWTNDGEQEDWLPGRWQMQDVAHGLLCEERKSRQAQFEPH